jgi:hypothetical protein
MHTNYLPQLGQQHILRNLYNLLNQSSQPVPFETITEALWKEQYNPLFHDNRIYVSIRRLRKLVGDEPHRPKVILKARDGYYLREKNNIPGVCDFCGHLSKSNLLLTEKIL